MSSVLATQRYHLQLGGNGELIHLGASFKNTITITASHALLIPRGDLTQFESRQTQRNSGWGLGVEGRWTERMVGEE